MKVYYLFEIKSFIRNKKNIAAFILLLLATLYYSIILSPEYVPNERINETEIRQDYEEMTSWLDNMRGDGISEGSAFALSYFPELIELNEKRLASLEEEDFQTYAETTSDWYLYQDDWIYSSPEFLSYNRAYYGIEQDYPQQEGRYWYMDTANRYEAYTNMTREINPSILEEKTGLQTGFRVWNTTLVPVVLIGLVVIYSNDIVTKDKKHLSLVRSFPISFSGKLLAKTAVVLTASLFTSILLFMLGITIVSFKNGFGSFSIPVSIFKGPILSVANYDTITIGTFYLQAFALLLMISYAFTRFCVLCSLLFKNEYVTLLIGGALIFTERLYYIRGVGYFSNLDLIPSSFFSIGQVLSGYQNHLYNSSSISFQNGILSILVLILVIELSLFIVNKIPFVRSYV
ncbi:hypothetical protein [Marinilactibacillus kalidii]|uniref:hypothetical protein n=1 Tax=Marinilactibacillus kalidii TaxID=2820274 RepID=UPI001ABDF245|nr:hypothetical protein [Marinilactibacillus kalidii]